MRSEISEKEEGRCYCKTIFYKKNSFDNKVSYERQNIKEEYFTDGRTKRTNY